MTAIEMLKCPEENNLYFTGDFGFSYSKQYFKKGKENG